MNFALVFKSVFSRMFARTEIRPLHPEEIAQYVRFRLLMAGGRPDLIAEDAYAWLHERSGGIPREINRLCHNALALAARWGKRRVNLEVLQQLEMLKKV